MKILLADDEELARAVLKSMLEELGSTPNEICEARNGQEAVQLVKEMKPDLVFVDIRMPRRNGLEVIAEARACSPHTKWVILSGYSEFQYAKEALCLGACNYLLKPVSPEELQDCLAQISELRHKQMLEWNHQLEHAFITSLQGRQAGVREPAGCRGFITAAFFAVSTMPFRPMKRVTFTTGCSNSCAVL